MITYEDGTEERKELSLMERFKHIYIKEVVREPRMNYQRVPRLGAFMAVILLSAIRPTPALGLAVSSSH